MSKINDLIKSYERYVRLPWARALSGQEKTWFAVYSPADERRLRYHLPEFENATRRAGHGWVSCDVTNTFTAWMTSQEYRESYYESPDDIEMLLFKYQDHVAHGITGVLTRVDADDNTVVAVYGIASLFGFMRVSDLLRKVTSHVHGRLLVMFPGDHDGANYRLLDARDGWNYLAVPIKAD
ncbi:MAG: DUF1788 domain-containing protein [Chloroflexi bacterium]|nr:DUF1788 domain-containing protein [Chloroflexota bacterium]